MKKLLVTAFVAFALVGACTSDDDAAYSPSYMPDTSFDDTSSDPEFDTDGPEMQRLALDMTWNDMSLSDQQDMCDGLDMLGIDIAVQAILSGANSGTTFAFDEPVVADWLIDNCR